MNVDRKDMEVLLAMPVKSRVKTVSDCESFKDLLSAALDKAKNLNMKQKFQSVNSKQFPMSRVLVSAVTFPPLHDECTIRINDQSSTPFV
ncbi:hypothetical protein BaRGS_00031107 [Batillaria attramentaria]|uniref:Uncharacterized protein n=1 Tax=Batillaria attramentaria TaxID=370345 RepID=A0ABD0JSJ9_9CAEN